MLKPSFQREPPRRAPAQLDLNVVEGDELLHGFHPRRYRVRCVCPLLRCWPGWDVASSAAPVAVPRLLHHRSSINNEWMVGGRSNTEEEGEGRKFYFFVKLVEVKREAVCHSLLLPVKLFLTVDVCMSFFALFHSFLRFLPHFFKYPQALRS